MKKILAIIRTSTERQETESQKAEVKDFCISKGFRAKDIVYIESSGASARKLNKKYLAMLENIKNTISADKDIKAVALWHLNRLGRVEKCLLEMKDFFIENKIQVYIKEPSLTLFNDDMTINNGTEIAWSVFATMVKQDTNELFAKFERGRNRNRKEGKFNGGAYGALFGYMVDESGYIVPCPMEVEILNNIYKLYASGKYSIRSLTKELNERGILKRGRKFTENTLPQILSNTAYIGYSKKTDRKYDIIVNEKLWHKVEKIRKENDLGIKTKESKNVNLAIKLLKCRHCGHNYIATRTKYMCYKHVMNARFTEDCNKSVAINIKIMDMLLWQCAYSKHLDYMTTNKEKEISEMNERKEVLLKKIETALKDIESLKVRKDRANELYVNGEINRAAYDKMNGKTAEIENSLKADIKNYDSEIKAMEMKVKNLTEFDIDAFVNLGNDLYDIKDKKQIKDIVLQHVKECHVERVSYDGKKAIEIEINCYDGSVWKYIYFYTYKQKEKQLFIVHNDGKLVPYYASKKEKEEIKNNDEILKGEIYIMSEMVEKGKMEKEYLYNFLNQIEENRLRNILKLMEKEGILKVPFVSKQIQEYNERKLLKEIMK